MLALLVLVPIAVLLLLNLPLRDIPRGILTAVVAFLAFAELLAAIALPHLLAQDPLPFLAALPFRLIADDLTRVVLAAIGVVFATAVFIGGEAIVSDRKHRQFISLLVVSLTGMNATVLVSDFFSLYVFLEVIGVSSFILIALDKDLHAVEGAFRYLVLSAVASVFMLTAAGLLLLGAGDTGFQAVRDGLSGSSQGLVKVALVVFVLGMFIKGGVVPFHGWLPGAYGSAPAPVSVLLSGIVTKVSGIYALIRIVHSVYVPDEKLSWVLMSFGTISLIIGAVAAVGQTQLKRMLAYSSISQLGYIVLALGTGTELGVIAAAFHLFNHAVFKSLLFVNSAAIESRLETTELEAMAGVGAKMPVTGTTSILAMLSAAGIPPTAGFFSKLLIVLALVKANHVGFAVVAVLASILTLGYFMALQRQAIFGKPDARLSDVREATAGYLVPAIALGLVTVLTGALFPFLLNSPLSFLLLGKSLPW